MHVVSSTNDGKSPSYLYWWYKERQLDSLGFCILTPEVERTIDCHWCGMFWGFSLYSNHFTKPFNQYVSSSMVWRWCMVTDNLWNCSARMYLFKSQISADSKQRGRPQVSLFFVFTDYEPFDHNHWSNKVYKTSIRLRLDFQHKNIQT